MLSHTIGVLHLLVLGMLGAVPSVGRDILLFTAPAPEFAIAVELVFGGMGEADNDEAGEGVDANLPRIGTYCCIVRVLPFPLAAFAVELALL